MNRIYEIEEGRPFWKLRPVMLLLTLVAVVLAAVALLILVLSGPVLTAVANTVGLGSHGGDGVAIAKWPVLALVVVVIVGAAVLRHPQREAAEVPLALRRRGGGHRDLGDRLGRLRVLRRDLLVVQQDLRRDGRRDRRPAVAVDHQPGAAVRRRARRRARARTSAAGRHRGRGGAPAPRARHPQHQEAAQEAGEGRRHRPQDPAAGGDAENDDDARARTGSKEN